MAVPQQELWVIRQNRAVPILLVLTIAWVLYLAGCFGREEPTVAQEGEPTPVVATPTAAPVVDKEAAEAAAELAEEPFVHIVEEGDLLSTIAAKYNVSPDTIALANPGLDPSLLIVGMSLNVPGATTDNTVLENIGPDRDRGVTVNYIVREGDVLGAIAETYTVSLEALLAANPETSAEALRIGEIIEVPPWGTGLSAEALAAQSTTVPLAREPGEIQRHIVEPGDLLSNLADLYSVEVDEIMAANSLDSPDEILVGAELVIPPPSRTVESEAAPATPTPLPDAVDPQPEQSAPDTPEADE